MLNSLPQSLDETYERILCSIDKSLIRDARRILTLLCFAARPLTVLELIDAVAVEINPPGLNPRRRLQDADDILSICPGLVDIDIGTRSKGKKWQEDTFRIAHFSVQEYLESERIRSQKARIFGLSGAIAHAEIAQISLIYWLEPSLAVTKLDEKLLKMYPLAHFAAESWYHHYKSADNWKFELDNLVLKLFKRQKDFVRTWIYGLRNREKIYDLLRASEKTPVYYASFLGLSRVLQELLVLKEQEDIGAHILPQKPAFQNANVNTNGVYYGNALQAASFQGHENIVQLLIEKGADIHAQGGEYGNALQAASSGGHENIVQLLIEKGADIGAQSEHYGNVLQAASSGGHENIVQLLIEKGADIHAQGGEYGNALQAASSGGHENIVQLLIEKGADIGAQSEHYGNVLQAASFQDRENIVQLLIEKGADINAHGGYYGNALQAASFQGNENIVQLLIEKGADVGAQGGIFGNALQAASSKGHENIVQILINNGADSQALDR